MENTNPQYKGLMETIELQRPPDAIPGEKTKNTGFALYPTTLDRVDYLRAFAGMSNRSQLLRALVNFTDSHQSEFAEYLAATNPKVKAG
jgi:hypothetical protein